MSCQRAAIPRRPIGRLADHSRPNPTISDHSRRGETAPWPDHRKTPVSCQTRQPCLPLKIGRKTYNYHQGRGRMTGKRGKGLHYVVPLAGSGRRVYVSHMTRFALFVPAFGNLRPFGGTCAPSRKQRACGWTARGFCARRGRRGAGSRFTPTHVGRRDPTTFPNVIPSSEYSRGRTGALSDDARVRCLGLAVLVPHFHPTSTRQTPCPWELPIPSGECPFPLPRTSAPLPAHP